MQKWFLCSSVFGDVRTVSELRCFITTGNFDNGSISLYGIKAYSIMATNLQFVKEVNSTDVVSVTATDLFNTQYEVYEVYLDMLYNASSYLDIYLFR